MHEKYFDITCQKCPRLAAFLCDVKEKNPTYYAKPVAPFGDDNARLLIVGLAPGMHGANATGRPFTGDYAGILLYEALHEFGFSNCSESTSANDGLLLKNARITNAVKCLPPQNKPKGEEINTCNSFLSAELLLQSRWWQNHTFSIRYLKHLRPDVTTPGSWSVNRFLMYLRLPV